MSASLSVREFAAQVQKSPTVIQRLKKAGKIPTGPDGKIPMPEGLHAYLNHRAIDVPAAPPPPAVSSPPRVGDQFPDGAGEPAMLRLAQNIREAELAVKAWDARNRELKYWRERGQLVPVDEVRADARAACETIRTHLLALGSRLALVIEEICARDGGYPRAATIQSTIEDEVNAILTVLHATRFTAATPGQQEIPFTPTSAS